MESLQERLETRAAIHAWFRWGSSGMRIFVLSLLLFLAVCTAVVWFAAPYLTRDYINRGLSGLPDYTGRVESVRIHPWTASIDVYAVRLDKKAGTIPVHFFYSQRTTISLQWSQIIHRVQRASVIIYDPQVNLVMGPNLEESQLSISKIWIDAIKEMIPWRVNQVLIHNGNIHLLDFHADPQINLEMNQVELIADNMSNSTGLKTPLPATVKITGDASSMCGTQRS